MGLGVKAIEQGFSAQFYRFDGLDFEPMDRTEASLFFRLVTYRYGRG